MGTEQDDFWWLGDLSKWQCFTTCELSRPAKSLDFGNDGFTASLTDWHELLQLTRPDSTCGVVFLRGRFPDNAASVLSRAQRRDDGGSNGTFGTRLLKPHPDFPDVELGERKAQGWVNFRWPYTQYELVRRHPETGDVLGTGSCECISFVSKGTVFQITRLKWGQGTSLSEYDADGAGRGSAASARFRVGGSVRFGCPCSSAGGNKDSQKDSFKISPVGLGLCCTSAKYQTSLKIGLSVSGEVQRLTDRQNSVDGLCADLTTEYRVDLAVGEPISIISSYTLRNDEEDAERDLDTSLPAELLDYLGVSRESVNMTDRLWTALCATNYEAVEAVEFCIVGRCVEQILGVTAVPVRHPSKSSSGLYGMPETALIGNIMTYQYVDVQSMFFQIRLLVKLQHFVKTRRLEPDLLQPYCDLERIRDMYLVRLEKAIRSSVTWLFMTDLKPVRLLLAVHSDPAEGEPTNAARDQRLKWCASQRELLRWDQSYNRGCYASMAGWLLFRVCPEVVTNGFINEVVLPKLPVGYEAGISRDLKYKQPTSKSNVLHWLHFSCILLLQDAVGWEENDLPDGVHREDLDLKQVMETQKRFEKQVSRLKTSSADGWSIEYEELDRVLLLADEMGLDRLKSERSHSLAVSRVRQTRKRIQDRKRTTKFNTGPKQWMAMRSLSNGPWELMCTNHEAYLRVAGEADVIPARDRLFEFLLSDYSFMASWDHADANMVGRWWSIQPVAMICATLLDLKLEGKLQAAKALNPSLEGPMGDDMAQSMPNLRSDTVLLDGSSAPARGAAATQAALIQALVQQLRQSTDEGAGSSSVRAFDWITAKPSPIYYPTYATQSLDDTPEIYGRARTRDVHLRRSLQHYLETHGARDIAECPGYTLSNVKRYITHGDLCLLDVFDVFQNTAFEFHTQQQRCSPPTTLRTEASSTHSKPSSHEVREDKTFADYETVLHTLNDSLVDVGAKHRILFARRLSPALVGGVVYLWHPDAFDSIDDHFGAISRFTESREKSMWTTSITISHWAIRTVDEHRADPHRETHRQNGDFPPENIVNLGYESDEMHVVEEKSSTLVFTGDPSGYLWICSVLSSSTDSDSIAAVVSRVLPNILAKFIHQQEIARCLAFLLLLGHLCEKLASEYGEVLGRLDAIMGIGDRTLLEGLEDWWGTVEAINKLKKMLWGWEALRVFNDKLSSSLSQIQRAQEAMENVIKHDASQQNIDLIQEYNSTVIDEFKKRHGMLVDVAEKTQLKIKQVTGLRDGISTITNVVDTQTALADNQTTIQQGNNIRTLTYITIAYLPLAFITGLFSIQHATFMDQATNWQFAVLIVLFSLGTYLLAFTLDRALVQFKGKFWPMKLRGKKGTTRKGDVEAIALETWPRRRVGGG